jgi:hypothetical protein
MVLDPRTNPTQSILPEDYSKRVIMDGREAPKLMLDFTCSLCGYVLPLDAYSGPYTCGSHESMYYKPFLTALPMTTVRPKPSWWDKGVPHIYEGR